MKSGAEIDEILSSVVIGGEAGGGRGAQAFFQWGAWGA